MFTWVGYRGFVRQGCFSLQWLPFCFVSVRLCPISSPHTRDIPLFTVVIKLKLNTRKIIPILFRNMCSQSLVLIWLMARTSSSYRCSLKGKVPSISRIRVNYSTSTFLHTSFNFDYAPESIDYSAVLLAPLAVLRSSWTVTATSASCNHS